MSLQLIALGGCWGGGAVRPEEQDGGRGLDGSSRDGSPRNTADAEPCRAIGGQPIELARDVETLQLTVVGDQIVFRESRAGGMATPTLTRGGIRKVRKDGTGDEVIYVPSGDGAALGSSPFPYGDTVYFTQRDPATAAYFLWSVPLTGGTPTRLHAATTEDFQVTWIFAVDDSFVYFAAGPPEKRRLYRASKADGARSLVAGDVGDLRSPQLFGEDVWYSPLGNRRGFYKAPKDGTMPLGTRVGSGTCDSDKMVVNQAGIFCGRCDAVVRYDLDGESRASILEVAEGYSLSERFCPLYYWTSDDGAVYAFRSTVGRTLYRGSATGAEVDVLLCDRERIVDLHATAADIVWLEVPPGASVGSIYRLPLPAQRGR